MCRLSQAYMLSAAGATVAMRLDIPERNVPRS